MEKTHARKTKGRKGRVEGTKKKTPITLLTVRLLMIVVVQGKTPRTEEELIPAHTVPHPEKRLLFGV